MSKIYVPTIGGKHGLTVDNSKPAITEAAFQAQKARDMEVAESQCSLLTEQMDLVLKDMEQAVIRRKDRRAIVVIPYNAILDIDMIEVGKSDKLEDDEVIEEARRIVINTVNRRCERLLNTVDAKYTMMYIAVDLADDEDDTAEDTTYTEHRATNLPKYKTTKDEEE